MSTKRPLTNDQLVKAAITTKRCLEGFSDVLRPHAGRPVMLIWFAEGAEGKDEARLCAPLVPDPDGRLLRMQIRLLRQALAALEAAGWQDAEENKLGDEEGKPGDESVGSMEGRI